MDLNNKPDMVSHPPHYQSQAGLEVIDVIKAFTADLKGIEATDTGNIIKYICRWKHKNGLEDLKKARWYLDHLINVVDGNSNTEYKPNVTIVKTKECEYETSTHPYGYKACLGTKEKDLCPGYNNCDRYKPIDD